MRTAPIFRFAAAAALLGGFPAAGQDEADLPDPIEVREDFTLHFSQIDVMGPQDPTELVAGVTDQFLDGRKLLGEVRLKAPIAVAELKAMAREKGSTAFSFRCSRVGLYEAGKTHLVGGEDCEMVADR